MVDTLEKGLGNFAEIICQLTGKCIKNQKGSGAAGGIPIGMGAFLDAEIVPGANFVMDILSFEQHVRWADLVITGEGKFDSQTFWNKAPYAVAKCAKKYRKPVIGIAGSTEPTGNNMFDGVFSIINQPCSLDYAIKNTDKLVYNTARELACFILAVNSYRIELKNGIK
jgi:glycerate kinase